MKKLTHCRALAFHLVLLFLLFLTTETRAKKIYVGPNETYDNIMWGLTAADAGDTVIVKDGVYVQDIKVRESVVLMAENRHGAVIGDGSDTRALISIRQAPVDGAVIDGFKFAAGDYNSIFVGDMDAEKTPINCIIKNNLIEGRKSGIIVSPHTSNTTISGNTIEGCSGTAVQIQGIGTNIIIDNTLQDCDGGGIFLSGREEMDLIDTTTIRGNIIKNNKLGGIGIERWKVIMEKNLIEGNLLGIGTNSGKSGLVVRDSNQVINNLEQGIFIENGSQAVIEGNIISGNGREGIRAHGMVNINGNEIESNSEWGVWIVSGRAHVEDNDLISNGIHGIEFGDQTEGVEVYYNRITGNQLNGIVAASNGFIVGNLIDGNGEHGIQVFNTGQEVEIKGFNTISNNQRHEILLDAGSSAVIRDNIIEHDNVNIDERDGFSGIRIEGSARIERNLIRNISDAGISIVESASDVGIFSDTIQNCYEGIIVVGPAVIHKNIIKNQLEQGIWIGRPAHDVTLTKNEIRENGRAGIFYQSGIPNLTIALNKISENNSGVVSAGEAKLRSNTIRWNNECGIKIRGAGIDLGNETDADSGMNAILENGEWNIWSNIPDTIFAWYNYWGLNDADSIDATIWDDDEDSLTGPVLFEPFLDDLNVGVDQSILPGTGPGIIEQLEVFPNPSQHHVTIRFLLRSQQAVHLNIIDPSGRIALSMIAGREYVAGEHQVVWNGTTGGGDKVPGTYLVVLKAGKEVNVQKILLLR